MTLLLSGERSKAAAAQPHVRSFPARLVKAWIDARRRRRALVALLELEEERLDDLGINRSLVLEAMRNPKARIGLDFAMARARRARGLTG
ncbi:hypothetical protein GCM10007989_28120 [Devosia pacifica]|uniref:DUF1127 domain-containing protein n=1 Tax=Devosia pacifica TaxID=1335967 RepID=A0A918S8W3_9HYPH|nr:hypothetical protein [Devosia pacifica]GHA30617.1 hypothetical protein GCM10007989_28120 [Devosia pacifica]